MAEITVPDPDELILSNLDLATPTQVNRSAWVGTRKILGLPGPAAWQGTVAIDTITTEEAERPWRAFLFDLEGPVNHFRWPLPCNTHIGPKPLVGAGATDGKTLPLTGMQPSTTILRAGQFMTVPLPSGHHRAVVLTAPLVTDASGNATATYKPALNEVPVEGATVETAYPFIPMSPVEGTMGLATAEGVSGTSFDVEEAR